MCTPMIAPAEAVAPGAFCHLTDPFVGPMRLGCHCQLLAMSVEHT